MSVFTDDEQREWLSSLDARPSSAAVVIEDGYHRVLTIKATYKNSWSPAGGVIDPGETPLQAAIREVKEEVGVTLDPSELSFLTVASRSVYERLVYQFVFYAKVTDGRLNNIKLQDGEVEDYIFLTRDEVLNDSLLVSWPLKFWAKGGAGYVETQVMKLENHPLDDVKLNVPMAN